MSNQTCNITKPCSTGYSCNPETARCIHPMKRTAQKLFEKYGELPDEYGRTSVPFEASSSYANPKKRSCSGLEYGCFAPGACSNMAPDYVVLKLCGQQANLTVDSLLAALKAHHAFFDPSGCKIESEKISNPPSVVYKVTLKLAGSASDKVNISRYLQQVARVQSQVGYGCTVYEAEPKNKKEFEDAKAAVAKLLEQLNNFLPQDKKFVVSIQ